MTPILDISELVVEFSSPSGLFKRARISAVDKVSIKIEKGEAVGIVGESGSGKTTIARCIVKLVEPTSGKILFDGQDIFAQASREKKEYRKHVQMIFQDPYESLNPRASILQIVEEPLIVHKISDTRDERKKKVYELLQLVGLEEELATRYPHELSGGQRQRVSIARALAVNPQILVCDEPVSMLDVSIRLGILDLLKDLKKTLNLTFVFITHDLGVARYFCDRVAVIYRGQMMEAAETEGLITQTMNPYTQLLLDSVPGAGETKITAEDSGEQVPDTKDQLSVAPSGCRFNNRCPNARETCTKSPPPFEALKANHYVACYYPLDS
jgi:oligopeptide/dipeptide ABC transporter ATP-binding protein